MSAKRRGRVYDPMGRLMEEYEEEDAYDSNGALRDGFRLVVPTAMMDSVQRSVRAHFGDIDQLRCDHRTAVEAAYAEIAQRDAAAHKQPLNPSAINNNIGDAQNPELARIQAITDAKERAYRLTEYEDANAWRRSFGA